MVKLYNTSNTVSKNKIGTLYIIKYIYAHNIKYRFVIYYLASLLFYNIVVICHYNQPQTFWCIHCVLCMCKPHYNIVMYQLLNGPVHPFACTDCDNVENSILVCLKSKSCTGYDKSVDIILNFLEWNVTLVMVSVIKTEKPFFSDTVAV